MGKGRITREVSGHHNYRKLPRAELKKQIRSIWETPDDCSVIAPFLLLAFAGMEQSGVFEDGSFRLSFSAGDFVMESRPLYNLFHIRHAATDPVSKNTYLCKLLERLRVLGLVSFNAYAAPGDLTYYHIRIVEWYDKTRKRGANSAVRSGVGYAYLQIDSLKQHLERSGARLSQRDALIDLWLHIVYQDENVDASERSPLVSYPGTEGGLLSTTFLAERWGWLRSSVYAFLKKLARRGCINWFVFGGRKGSLIFIPRYLTAVLKEPAVLPDPSRLEQIFDCKLKSSAGQTPATALPEASEVYYLDLDKLNTILSCPEQAAPIQPGYARFVARIAANGSCAGRILIPEKTDNPPPRQRNFPFYFMDYTEKCTFFGEYSKG